MKNKINSGVLIFILLVFILYILNRRTGNLSMTPLTEFAVNYKPCVNKKSADSKFTICFQPPLPPREVINILNKSEINEEYKKYVLLIFLKLCAFQLQTYHQGYDVREEPFLLTRFGDKSALIRAYCEILGTSFFSKIFGREYLSPDDALDYLEIHPDLKQYPLIMEQINKINYIVATITTNSGF